MNQNLAHFSVKMCAFFPNFAGIKSSLPYTPTFFMSCIHYPVAFILLVWHIFCPSSYATIVQGCQFLKPGGVSKQMPQYLEKREI